MALEAFLERVAESAGQARTTWALRLWAGRDKGSGTFLNPYPHPSTTPQIYLGELQQLIKGTPYTAIKHLAQDSYTHSIRLEGKQNIHKQRE